MLKYRLTIYCCSKYNNVWLKKNTLLFKVYGFCCFTAIWCLVLELNNVLRRATFLLFLFFNGFQEWANREERFALPFKTKLGGQKTAIDKRGGTRI